MADVDEYKKFVPFCVDSKVVRVIDSQTIEADMSVGFKVGLTPRRSARTFDNREIDLSELVYRTIPHLLRKRSAA